jgi:radical SAM superfamily enzyme YgiQ (UPF0313 family)
MESLKDRHWRPYPPDAAIEQIRIAAEKYHVKAIAIGDACFGVKADWRKDFLRRLADLKPSYWILMETRPEFLDEDDIKIIANLKMEIQFGVESCSPQMLKLMNKTKHPEKFLNNFRRISHMLSDHGIVHGANLIFNHPGETRKTLEETFAFVDSELNRSDSSLIWACNSYRHFPGSALDRNRHYYEREFGTVFLNTEWWLDDKDPLAGSMQVVPSRDLSGDRTGMWVKMLRDRDDRFKDCLTQQAFSIAAMSYFREWRDDPRFVEI